MESFGGAVDFLPADIRKTAENVNGEYRAKMPVHKNIGNNDKGFLCNSL